MRAQRPPLPPLLPPAPPGQLPRLGCLLVFCASLQPRTWCAFAGGGIGISAMVARRVLALQLLVAERAHGHPCLSPWVEGPGACEAVCGGPQPRALPDAGPAFGPLPGQPPRQALGTHGAHHSPLPEMGTARALLGPTGSGSAGTVDGSDWQMPSLSPTVWVPPVIFVWGAHMGGWKTGSQAPRASLPSPELGSLEVLSLCLFALEDSGWVPKLTVPGSSESMTIICN